MGRILCGPTQILRLNQLKGKEIRITTIQNERKERMLISMRWFLLHSNQKNEKLKNSIPRNLTDTRNLWTKTFLNCYGPMHYHLPSHVSFFQTDWDCYLYEVSVEPFLNEPRHWQHVLLCQTCHNCVTFYCNTKSYCPITLNQILFYVFIRMCDSLFIVGADNRPIYQGTIEYDYFRLNLYKWAFILFI